MPARKSVWEILTEIEQRLDKLEQLNDQYARTVGRPKITRSMEALQKETLILALQSSGGDIEECFELLKIGRRTFFYRCKKFGIMPSSYKVKRGSTQS